MMRRVCVLSLAMITALVLGGCGKKAQDKAVEKLIEKQSGGKVKADLSKGKMTFTDKDGQTTIQTGGGASLPEGFPKDVLVYKGAQIEVSSKQKKNFTLMLATKDDAKQVIEAYKSAMKSQGWEEANSMDMGGAVSLHYRKEKEKRSAMVSVTKSNDKTQINLMVEAEE